MSNPFFALPVRRIFSSEDKILAAEFENAEQVFLDALSKIGLTRETALAKTKLEEAGMWAMRAIAVGHSQPLTVRPMGRHTSEFEPPDRIGEISNELHKTEQAQRNAEATAQAEALGVIDPKTSAIRSADKKAFGTLGSADGFEGDAGRD